MTGAGATIRRRPKSSYKTSDSNYYTLLTAKYPILLGPATASLPLSLFCLRVCPI